MEWITVNDILKDDITKLNYTLIPPGFQGDVRSVRVMQERLSKVIDTLGEQSAAAQGLNKIITTAEKLRNSPAHILYLLKDPNANGGRGDVIGMLKVGHKHLFLFDEHDKVCEVEPLCVLDFFVLRDLQRHGYGQLLFNHMLKDTGAAVSELAIDGPSAKMEQFLARHYGVQRLLRQSNNFAVSPQFFAKAADMSKSGRSTPVVPAAVGRFAAPKPASAIATVIHGGGPINGKTSGHATPEETAPKHAPGPQRSLESAPEPEREPEPEPAPEPEPKPELKPVTERPSSLKVEPVAAASPAAALSPAGSTISRRDSQLTDRGFFDVKFYHNKLW